MADGRTYQSNIKSYGESDFITNYSLFLGGIDTTHNALKAYDPLKTGKGRIFFTRMPVFMQQYMPDATKRVRHIFEYGFTKINGIGDLELESENMTGGYAGNSIPIATLAKDSTNAITLGLYEFAGSPVREYIDMWIKGIADDQTGFSRYHGLITEDPNSLKYAQCNHTAEAFYVVTDPTGLSTGIEYCCMLTNMFPTTSAKDHFNYNSGESTIVQIDVPFSCVKRESPAINEICKRLIKRFGVLTTSMDFNPGEVGVETKFRPYIESWGANGNGATKAEIDRENNG
jgi:hypothetical protein